MYKSRKTAFVFSALLGFTMPLASSFAASPNAINNQTAQLVAPAESELGSQALVQPRRSTGGVYDRYDVYRDQEGFPLPGEAQLFQPID